MQIAFISDIHANLEAFSHLEKDLMKADLVICLGDYVGYFCQVNEVIGAIRKLGGLCILGNHDYYMLYGCPDHVPPAVKFGIDYARSTITLENRAWLSNLPMIWGGVVGGVSVIACHGSPWDPINDYLYANSSLFGNLDEYQYDVIAFGQTHRSFIRMDRKPYLVNPGSVGQSRDKVAVACAAILNTGTMQIQQFEYPYNAETVLESAFRNGAGDWIIKHMR